MIVLQMVLYCLLFIGLVKCAVRDNGMNCLYFYPKEFIEEAQRREIADKLALNWFDGIVLDRLLVLL